MTFAAQGLIRPTTPAIRMIARFKYLMAFFPMPAPALLRPAFRLRLQREALGGKGQAFSAVLPCNSCKFLCNSLADGWPFGHSLAVIPDLRKSPGINTVPLQPLRDREQVGVADRVDVAHHPWPSQHFDFD